MLFKIVFPAQLGGVFNVFFGCSILTLLEIAVLVYRGLAEKMLANSKEKDKPQSNQAGNKHAKNGKNKKKKLAVKF